MKISRILQVTRRSKSKLNRSTCLISKRSVSTSKNEDCNDSRKEQDNATNTSKANSSSKKLLKEINIGTSRKKYTSVPRVPTTEYISISDIETEGLFAGYRPLFLGKSTLQGSEYMSKYDTDSILSSIANSKLIDVLTATIDNPKKRRRLKEMINVNKNDRIELQDDNSSNNVISEPRKTPIVPWDASIGGMIYSNEPFKNVPKNVVSKLKPFELQKINKNEKQKIDNENNNSMIIMKVHNSRINDDFEIVDLFAPIKNQKLQYYNKNNEDHNQLFNNIPVKKLNESKRNYKNEHKKIAYNHKFINDDQQVLKNEIKKLMSLLSDIFYKQSGLTVYSDAKSCLFPLNVYVQLTKSSGRSNKQFIRKTIMDQIFPIYSTVVARYKSQTEINEFKRYVASRVSQIIKKLSQKIPSLCFTDSSKSIDCLTRKSPVPGFCRMYWLKPTKRFCTFWGRNSDKEYTLKLKNNQPITRNGVKYMKYPNSINWRPMDDAFNNWDYFTRL